MKVLIPKKHKNFDRLNVLSYSKYERRLLGKVSKPITGVCKFYGDLEVHDFSSSSHIRTFICKWICIWYDVKFRYPTNSWFLKTSKRRTTIEKK